MVSFTVCAFDCGTTNWRIQRLSAGQGANSLPRPLSEEGVVRNFPTVHHPAFPGERTVAHFSASGFASKDIFNHRKGLPDQEIRFGKNNCRKNLRRTSNPDHRRVSDECR
jgi:hypothetical protein